MADCDVTVVITSYNQAAFVQEAVESALAQTVPARVRLVDDGSADETTAIAEGCGIEVSRLPHRGALPTFRAAVDSVVTPFYCLLNADDVLDERFVELTRPALEDPRVGFVYTGVEYFGAERRRVAAAPFDARALRWANFAHAASLTRKGAYDAVGGFSREFRDGLEDWALWVSMVSEGWRGVAVDEPLLRYRRHLGGSRNPVDMRDIERARWHIAMQHPGFYGPFGFARLLGSAVHLALTGR